MNDYIQVAQRSHVAISIAALQDTRLSLKAKGLYSLLYSNTGKIYIKDIIENGPDGETSVRNALKELREAGYIIQERLRGSMGRLAGYSYTLLESGSSPYGDFPNMGNPDVENPASLESNKKLESSKLDPNTLTHQEKVFIGGSAGASTSLINKKKSKKDYTKTCLGMINIFSQNQELRYILRQYFDIRRKRGLTDAQFRVLLDELKEFCNNDETAMIEQAKKAFAGGYMHLAYKPNQNTGGHSKGPFEYVDIRSHGKSESDGELARDENGEVLVY